MAEYLSKEKVEEIFQEYGGSAGNTGSTEGQVALFSYRIKELSKHLTLVGKRRRLLRYLAKKDIVGYRALIEKLGIRKQNF